MQDIYSIKKIIERNKNKRAKDYWDNFYLRNN